MTARSHEPADGSSGQPAGLDRLASLTLVTRTASAANASTTFVDAATVAIEEVCGLVGWPAGRLWMVDEDDPSALVPTSVWRLGEGALADASGEWPAGDGLPGGDVARRAVVEARTTWAVGDPAAARLGLGTTLAFPVTVSTRPAAVLEFFARDEHPPGDEVLEVMAAVTEELARVVERERAMNALRRSEERLRALVAGPATPLEGPPGSGEIVGRDVLTGLADRAVFHARLDLALDRAGRHGSSMAVFWCDLDRFRSVNDSFGHAAGDRVMVSVARRLAGQVPPGATVARMGSDEFAVSVEDVDGEEVAELVERVQQTFATPFDLAGTELWVTASIGVAVATGGGADVVLREASAAMHRAKQRGRGRAEVFDEAMRSAAPWRSVGEHELREALAADQLRLRYQPIVDLSGGAMVGVEALVRWQHPSRGLLQPGDFIPLAETSGLVVPLGDWVLNEACRQAARWQSAGSGRSLMLTVNVAAQQFAETNWVSQVAAALAASGLAAECLVLEITESALMEDTEVSATALGDLRALGVRLAIDDFGTGYSSLAYLRRMPVDFLKIDKAFVDGITGDAHESALARALVKLAGTLDLTPIAEGIERREQAEVLAALRCRLGQGMWLGAPEPPASITDRLR